MSIIPGLMSVEQRKTYLHELNEWMKTAHELEWDNLEQFEQAVDERLAEVDRHKRVLTGVRESDLILEEIQKPDPDKPRNGPPPFKTFGEQLVSIAQAGDVRLRGKAIDPRLIFSKADPEDRNTPDWEAGEQGEFKALAEAVGATGGFLVPPEFRADLLSMFQELSNVRNRATIIPMRRRTVTMPVLDQTGTTAGTPNWFGGIQAVWTEEAAQKDETDPAFRNITLTAHKLICYTRVSDELLDDSAIGLEAFFRSNMGFAGAIAWQEEFAFMQGSGAGQPLGVLVALAPAGLGPTLVVTRQAAGAVNIIDITNMLENFMGQNPVWMISRSMMSELLRLNGPAANPSFVFIPNAREGVPATLFGFPIIWSEMSPLLGATGDILLADWSKYLIGDRQQTIIDSTNIERFRFDQTSWRAVHRVDGQPWLSTPITYQDGTTQVSPFVVLGSTAGT